MLDVIVIGGGISGLAAAWRATEAGHQVQLLESSKRLGGVIGSQRRDEGLLELGPDALLTSRASVSNLLEDLDLSGQVISPFPSRPWLGCRGSLHPLPEGFRSVAPTRLLPFIRTPLLSWRGKFRMLWDLVLPASPLKDQTLAELICRRFGEEVLEQLAQPLIGGIYASDPGQMSLAATMPYLLELEKKYGSLMRGLWKSSAVPPKMSSLPGGLGHLVSSLTRRLGPRIQTDAPVTRLTRTSEGWRVEAGERAWQARQVVIATSAPHCAKLVARLDPAMGQRIERIVCRDVAIVNLIYRADDLGTLPLDCQGFLLPLKERTLFSAVSLTQQKWPRRIEPKFSNFRLHLGGAGREDSLRHDDETLIDLAISELRNWLELKGEPLFSKLTRHHQAMPEYRLGHLDLVRGVEAWSDSMPGLHLTGNWLTGVGISECLARVERLIPKLTYSTVAALV